MITVKRQLKSITAILLVLSLMFLIACGSNSANNADSSSSPAATETTKASETPASETPTTAPKKDPVTLTFATYNEWMTQGTGMEEVFKLYEAATGNKIKVEIYPNDQFINILKAKFATGDVPDFYAMNAGENGMPYANLEELTGPWVDKMVEPVRKKVTRSADGKVVMAYFSPLGYYAAVYNKKVFADAGVKLPLMNYDQLVEACKAIQKLGIDPIYLMGKENWTAALFSYIGGVEVANLPGVAEKLATNQAKPSDIPEYVEMANRILALKPYFNKDFMSVPLAAGIGPVAEGKAAMTVMGDWYYDEILKEYPDKVGDLSIMPITLGDNFVSGVATYDQHAFAVPSAAKNKEAAKEAINFFMEPDNFKVLIKPYKGATPLEGYDVEMSPWQQEMADMMKQNNIPLTETNFSIIFGDTVDFGPIGQVYQEILAGKSSKAALDDWYKEYAKINKAKQTPGF